MVYFEKKKIILRLFEKKKNDIDVTVFLQKRKATALPMGSFFTTTSQLLQMAPFALDPCTVTPLRHNLSAVVRHTVSQCASDCEADRSSRKISIYSVFEPLNVIVLNRKSSHVNLFVKLYISMEIQETLL